jgi:hypothetical protein
MTKRLSELLAHEDGTWEQRYTHRPAREAAPPGGQGAYPERSNHRLPNGQDYREGRTLRGYDGGKKISSRKRHMLVDTEGLVIGVAVHEPNIVADWDGAKLLLEKIGIRWRGWRRFASTGATTAR